MSTIVEGINAKQGDLPRIVKDPKSTLACGGTMKEEVIMLPGDHWDEVKGYLLKMDFNHRGIEMQ